MSDTLLIRNKANKGIEKIFKSYQLGILYLYGIDMGISIEIRSEDHIFAIRRKMYVRLQRPVAMMLHVDDFL